MKFFRIIVVTVSSLVTSHSSFAQPISSEPLAQKGGQLFSDHFERTDLGEWKTVIPTFNVKDTPR